MSFKHLKESNPELQRKISALGGRRTAEKIKIIDEFTDLPVSRQRKHQLRQAKKAKEQL